MYIKSFLFLFINEPNRNLAWHTRKESCFTEWLLISLNYLYSQYSNNSWRIATIVYGKNMRISVLEMPTKQIYSRLPLDMNGVDKEGIYKKKFPLNHFTEYCWLCMFPFTNCQLCVQSSSDIIRNRIKICSFARSIHRIM